VIHKSDIPVEPIEDWFARCSPKSARQWKDGRSAKEAGHCWVGMQSPTLPPEVAAALASNPDFGEVTRWSGEPEAQVRFDGHSGPANIDLLLHASDARGEFVVAVEAKADEPFGNTVAGSLARSLEVKLSTPNSKRMARMEELVRALFHPREKRMPRLEDLRYQLLTATAAALAVAHGAGTARAVVLVQEFRTHLTTPKRRKENHADLTSFVRRISGGAVSTVEEGRLYGPFRVPGGALFSDPAGLYVGKVGREVASDAS